MWGATGLRLPKEEKRNISIHAPRVGRDTENCTALQMVRISIHAPRVGRDDPAPYDKTAGTDFNPRAPCGARPESGYTMGTVVVFQSTRPVWGATLALRGTRQISRYFNPRAPCGARQSLLYKYPLHEGISIHAPRVGRDLREQWAQKQADISIHAPRVGRDEYGYGWGGLIGISIHAPRVGRDHNTSLFSS